MCRIQPGALFAGKYEIGNHMNFILFCADEMRAESLSVYGHPLVKTPSFDRLAEEGTIFDQCHVQHTVCSPSRCSLMTGWYPHVSGHRTLWHLLRPHEPSLFRYLKDAGYHVEWHGKNDLYSEDSFPLCVDRKARASVGHHGGNLSEFGQPGYYSFLSKPFSGTVEQTSDMQDVMAGIDFLKSRKRDDPPFVLYLPLTMPHPGYGAPQPFHDMYSTDDIPPLRPAECEEKPVFHSLIRTYRQLDDMVPGTLEKIQAVYLGMCSCIDRMLGALMDTLDETGLADETAVFVYSDHGDWAGDFGLVEKWPSGLDDTLTRVPLAVRIPQGAEGHRVGEQVELFDIMATVLELAQVEARHTHFARSLVSQLRGDEGDPERAVFAEGGYDIHEPRCFEGMPVRDDFMRDPRAKYYPKALQQQEHPESVQRSVMIRTLRHKLIRRNEGVSELYDLTSDPRELKNVYGTTGYDQVRASLEQRLLDWYIHTSDTVPWDENERGLP